MAIKTTFNSVDEYIEDLSKDIGVIERGLLRATCQSRLIYNGAVREMSVVAGAIVQGRLVELKKYAGELWGHDKEKDKKVADNAAEIIQKLRDFASQKSLDFRAGCFDLVEE